MRRFAPHEFRFIGSDRIGSDWIGLDWIGLDWSDCLDEVMRTGTVVSDLRSMICDLRIRLRSLELLAEPFFMAFFWIKSRVLPGFMSGKAGPAACRRLHEKRETVSTPPPEP